jgi:hypothetical protein
MRAGSEALREKIRAWRPNLVLFAFRAPAVELIGRDVEPGLCGEVEGVPAFLLSGPYAPRSEASRIDAELVAHLGGAFDDRTGARTQRITAKDIERGQIRLPRETKRLFPVDRREVEIVLRGARLTASYDPRTGPDRERSAVLRVGRDALVRAVKPDETLRVSRGLGGVPQLD